MRYRRNFLPVIASGKSDDEYSQRDNKTQRVRVNDAGARKVRSLSLPRIRNK